MTLTVHAADPRAEDFHYTSQIRSIKVASYGARMIEADDISCQLEVVVPGGGAYDVLTYSKEEIAHDVLDHYTWWLNTNATVAQETE